MRDHAIVSPQFWTGSTGQQLRKDADAQRLALYLLTCPSSNMIGLYYLPIPTICHELGMKESQIRKALRRGIQLGFCDYDEASEVIFVFEMARFQCGKSLAPKDKRKPAVERLLRGFKKNRFYSDFFAKYGAAYGLKMEASGSPFEGASILRLKDQDQDQDKDQDKESPQAPAAAGGVASVETKKQKRSSGQKPEHPHFAAFWQAYPRKIARPNAATAFAKIDPDESLLAKMHSAVEWQSKSESWLKEAGQFIPHPATWLNGRRWEDEPPQEGLFVSRARSPTQFESKADREVRELFERQEIVNQTEAELALRNSDVSGDCQAVINGRLALGAA